MHASGGITNAVRGPFTYFYMLPDAKRLVGLTTALTLKFTQVRLACSYVLIT